MPQKRQSEKALRQNIVRHHRNKLVKSNLRELIKDSRKAIVTKDKTIVELMPKTVKAIDKALQHGQLKKNTAARMKSRLMKAQNKAKA